MTDLKRLERPNKRVDVVLDTDTFNEIDDQYALAYLIKSEEKLNLKGIYAAPFYNDKAESPEDGMIKSYNEILNILKLMKRDDLRTSVYKGSTKYLVDEKTPVTSDAANDLVKRAQNYTSDNPLYVIAIGAITNVASAILTAPELTEKIVVIWLGGNAHSWINNWEFNLQQDVAGARVLFGCGVPLVQLPCMGVVSAFTTTGPEITHWLKGKNDLCDYLVDTTTKEANKHHQEKTWSRAIWDVTAVAWLLGDEFMYDTIVHSPIPQYDHKYSFDNTRHFIKYVFHINRDKLMQDLFEKLAN